MTRRLILLLLSIAMVAASAPAGAVGHDRPAPRAAAPGVGTASAEPRWVRTIDRLIRGRPFGVAVREGRRWLYRRQETTPRVPASNEKLLMSMAILDRLGHEAVVLTQAASLVVNAGVIPGDLWILGQGDPSTGAAEMKELARAVQAAGVVRIEGSVLGSTAYFKRDWHAPGWKPSFRREEVALPTALTFDGNTSRGVHIRDPERLAARAMTQILEKRGVRVAGTAGSGKPPAGLLPVAGIETPLVELLAFTNHYSSNFYAEVLGKRLGVETAGVPGSIAKGASAIGAWAREHGVRSAPRDASGLSYENRVSAGGIARLLTAAELEPWGESLRSTLPRPGAGTLEHRLPHVRVRAKTGTLTSISALSGWVFLRREGVWAEFSLLSRGLSKDRAVRIEDAIVRVLSRSATL